MSEGHNGIAVDQLRALVERIERLDGEIKDLNADKSEVFKEAKSNGWDVNVLRKIIKARAMEDHKRKEETEIFALYAEALGLQMGLPL